MGMISRLGKWLDTRFPEKVIASDILPLINEVKVAISNHESVIATLTQYGKSLEARLIAMESQFPDVKNLVNNLTQLRADIASTAAAFATLKGDFQKIKLSQGWVSAQQDASNVNLK